MESTPEVTFKIGNLHPTALSHPSVCVVIKEMYDSNFEDVKLTLPRSDQSPSIGTQALKAERSKRYDYLFKLIVIGDPSVGKTNLTMKFCDCDFTPNYVSTIGIDFKMKTIEIRGQRVKLQIWDTAGQERFQTISKMYYRGAHGVLFVYDVTHRQSFENVRKWIAAYENASGESPSSSETPKALIANKCDDDEHRVVTKEAGEAASKCYKLKYFETSAKTGYNVENMFIQVADEILGQIEAEHQSINLPKTVLSRIKYNKRRNETSRKRTWSWSCDLL